MVSNINMLIPVSLTFGTCRALGTLVSQAYGQQNYKACAEYLNKQLILVTSWFIPIVMVLLNTSDILTFVGMNAQSSLIAG